MKNKNDEPKTDEEIAEMFFQEMMPEWIKVLTTLWTAFGKSPTPETVEIYKDQLGGVPLGILELAVKRTIRNHKYANVPTVHDVWESVRKELNNPPDIDQGIEEWLDASWERCKLRFFERQQERYPVAVETAMQS